MVSDNGDATLGAVWVVVAISFDPYAGHGWYDMGYVAFTAEAEIILPVYHCVYGVISKSLFLLLVALYPVVPVRMVFVCHHREGNGAFSYEREGGDKRCAGLVRWS